MIPVDPILANAYNVVVTLLAMALGVGVLGALVWFLNDDVGILP